MVHSEVQKLIVFFVCSQLLAGCYFFRKKGAGESASESTETLLGNSLGQRAKGPDYAALEDIYAIAAAHPAAAIRPDPDTYVRKLLRRYREEGATVAQEIGRTEPYRPLLGGASVDFKTVAQDRFDATSLLAGIKVAETVCTALVAPTTEQSDWKTILPYAPDKIDANIKFLAQRFTGIRTDKISTDKLKGLRAIFDLKLNNQRPTPATYVPVCAALTMDAEGLML